MKETENKRKGAGDDPILTTKMPWTMSLPTYCHCLMNKLTWISRYWVGNLIIRSFSFEIVLKRKIDFTRGSEAELNCPIALSESGKTQRRRIAAAPSSQIISREVLKSEKNTFEC